MDELNEYLECTCGHCEDKSIRELKACPKCGGKVVKIIYGEPTEELFEAADRGEVILGGCCIALDENGNQISPEYGCVDCDERF